MFTVVFVYAYLLPGAIPTACTVSPHHVVSTEASSTTSAKATGTATVPAGSLLAPTPSTLPAGGGGVVLGAGTSTQAPISVSRLKITTADAPGKPRGASGYRLLRISVSGPISNCEHLRCAVRRH